MSCQHAGACEHSQTRGCARRAPTRDLDAGVLRRVEPRTCLPRISTSSAMSPPSARSKCDISPSSLWDRRLGWTGSTRRCCKVGGSALRGPCCELSAVGRRSRNTISSGTTNKVSSSGFHTCGQGGLQELRTEAKGLVQMISATVCYRNADNVLSEKMHDGRGEVLGAHGGDRPPTSSPRCGGSATRVASTRSSQAREKNGRTPL